MRSGRRDITRLTFTAVLGALGAAADAAQEDVTGKYSGSIVVPFQGRDAQVGLVMVISSVEGGRVKGVATMSSPTCGGDYPFEGFLKANEIGVRSDVKGGRAGDCSFGMRGTIEGDRIVGTIGRSPLQLNKQR